jgi:serine/threonine protein kinase
LACKIIKKASLNDKLQQNLKSEIGILSSITSPYVIGLFDIQKTQNNFYLFMQYCNGGDLDELRQIRGRFSEQEA